MTTPRKHELKKQVWKLLREKAEARGLAYKNLHTPHQYHFDSVTSAGLFCSLQTLRDTPDVWMNPHANVSRKDVAALQRELGTAVNGGYVFSTNLGYLMPDRNVFHEWVFTDRNLQPGELIDSRQTLERVTYGDHRAVIDHLLDAFFLHAIPRLREFVELDVAIEARSCSACMHTWPIVLFLAGHFDEVDTYLSNQLWEFESSGVTHAREYREFTKTLMAKMGRRAPDPPSVIVPKLVDRRRCEHIRYLFDSIDSAEEAAVEFARMEIDATVHQFIDRPACTIKRIVFQTDIDSRYTKQMDKVAATFGGERIGTAITRINENW